MVIKTPAGKLSRFSRTNPFLRALDGAATKLASQAYVIPYSSQLFSNKET